MSTKIETAKEMSERLFPHPRESTAAREQSAAYAGICAARDQIVAALIAEAELVMTEPLAGRDAGLSDSDRVAAVAACICSAAALRAFAAKVGGFR